MIAHTRAVSFVIPVLLLLATHASAQSDYPLRDAVECHPRGGLPNFLQKVAAGETVKVAYLGGSITAAPGWRVQSREWLQKTYPEAKFEEIHAAIGGTGSDLGVFRLQRDVLQHQPDLLFVEFAVNDGGASPERIHKAMEGIIRQTWKADANTDICFVYTLTIKMLGDLQAGKMPRAASAMEELADHYGIPSIHFGVEVAKLEAAGDLVFQAPKPKDAATKPMVFSTDGVHPHVQTGHRLYVEAIARSWPKITAASGKAEPHEIVEPLRRDNWEEAKMVSIQPEMLSGDWTKLPADHRLAKRFRRNMPELFQAVEPDATLSFQFEGTAVAVFDVLGPDGGQLSVQLDDAKPVMRNRIDGYCTYHRMAKLNVGSELKPGVHTVTITLTPNTLDKRAILFERNRGDLESKPEKYQGHTWYPAALMLIGELK
ncbi:SGNH/GDSL hydrolase family protein [Thalassoroseus pseudoceratinae]|uniref:SGNH/GDSL hydrolase family protein n=1 Tax=Thalassoroseus pseudoceratinae TaxID=2713176 RepID=UPI001423C609|nr:SGNH/GDSL hydrolase family protein [Thalassoroseus pseudoceratinae]